jgi:hypothetical protein
MKAIDVPDRLAAQCGPKGRILPWLEGDRPLRSGAHRPRPAAAGEETGACPRLVRRTINGRIGIQEMSESQVFDAILGVITSSSIVISHCNYLFLSHLPIWHGA